MDIKEILKRCDHTQLLQGATREEIFALIDDAVKYGTASVCIPPSFVKRAKDYVKDRLKICTVIGFPNGYQTTAVKVFETRDAVENGADEIDMVINIGELKARNYPYLLNEINEIKRACGDRVLKVIIETCLLSESEKMDMCRIVSLSGADYIKTSTGFSTGGATLEDVRLMRSRVAPEVKVKAAGGISSLQDAADFLDAGAERLGTSRIVKLVKGESGKGY